MCCVDRNRNIKREAAKSAVESAVCKSLFAARLERVWRGDVCGCLSLVVLWTVRLLCCSTLRPRQAQGRAPTFIIIIVIIAKNLQMRLPVPVEEAGSLLDLGVMRAGIGTVDTRISQSRLICNNCTLAPIGLEA